MDDKVKKNLIEKYISFYNAFDIDGMMSVLHSEIEFINISNGEETAHASGEVDFRKLAEQGITVFSSRNQTIESFDIVIDSVTIGISYDGVIAIDLPNGLKAGDKISLKGTSIFSFRDGLIDSIIDES